MLLKGFWVESWHPPGKSVGLNDVSIQDSNRYSMIQVVHQYASEKVQHSKTVLLGMNALYHLN